MGEAAAKEPSMEDILSSIRKIIAEESSDDNASDLNTQSEDMDQNHGQSVMPEGHLSDADEVMTQVASAQQVVEAPQETQEPSGLAPEKGILPVSPQSQMPQDGAFDSTLTPYDQSRESLETEQTGSSEPAFQSSEDFSQMQTDQQFETPIEASQQDNETSLANLAASLRSHEENHREESALQSLQQQVEGQQGQAQTEHITQTEFSASQGVVDSQPEASTMSNEHHSIHQHSHMNPLDNQAETIPTADIHMGEATLPHTEQGELESVSPVSDSLSTLTTTEEEKAFRGALMSPSADSAVADAFDRLKRSSNDDLDAKTEAILRPMLREWLDENLPSLVERLVREEIERVARG